MADAGRVIAGTARGTRLEAPGDATRPLGDRVKQTLFAILEPDLRDARVLDLFAGSGAAGIEALSRGAAHATFVERDRARPRSSRRTWRDPPRRAARADRARRRSSRWLAGPRPRAAGPFDVVIVDPPYAEPGLLVAALEALGPLLAPQGPGWSPSTSGATRRRPAIGLLASERERRFGETTLTFYRRAEDR